MAENLTMKPVKGILKASSSFDHVEPNKTVATDIKWDEMNILQTLHPPDKDYGHMKIEEPKTPYSYYADDTEVSSHGDDVLDAHLLAEKITLSSDDAPKSMVMDEDDDEEDELEDENETEEDKVVRKAFEQKRKMHYDEYHAVKLARKLMSRDEEDDEEETMDDKCSDDAIDDKDSDEPIEAD